MKSFILELKVTHITLNHVGRLVYTRHLYICITQKEWSKLTINNAKIILLILGLGELCIVDDDQ